MHACTLVYVEHIIIISSLATATRCSSYTAAFKLKVVEFSERNGNRCAGRESRPPHVIWRATRVANVLTNRANPCMPGGIVGATYTPKIRYIIYYREDL